MLKNNNLSQNASQVRFIYEHNFGDLHGEQDKKF